MNVKLLIVGISVGAALFAAFVIGIIIIMRRKGSYVYKVTILDKDNFGRVHLSYDTARVFLDKDSNMENLYLKRNKIGLSPDNIPYVPDTKGDRHIILYRVGLKNFRFVNVEISDGNGPMFTVGEEDVNWAIAEYERAKKLAQKNWMGKVMPYLIGIIALVVVGIIAVMLIKKFDTIVLATENMKEVASMLNSASYNIIAAKNMTGTGAAMIVG